MFDCKTYKIMANEFYCDKEYIEKEAQSEKREILIFCNGNFMIQFYGAEYKDFRINFCHLNTNQIKIIPKNMYKLETEIDNKYVKDFIQYMKRIYIYMFGG